MARSVQPKRLNTRRSTRGRVGHQLIDIVTSGMYSNPLMVLREYVQNAVDAIEAAEREQLLRPGAGQVSVNIDGQQRNIVIEDNGIGVNDRQAVRLLGGLGVSSKQPGTARGFRGIGRLGGLGYANEVVFETRTSGQGFVRVVSWNTERLQQFLRQHRGKCDLEDAIERAVQMDTRPPRKDEGEHFFRVTLKQVRSFHRDDLMNLQRVGTYLKQVTPVPFAPDQFRFADEVNSHLSAVDGYRTFTVALNAQTLTRTHRNKFAINAQRTDEIRAVELFDIPGANGRVLGRGWYAVTDYIAAVPPRVAMRGVRVRQGNIEIGDEHFLAEWFSERRFATWHIGELHVDYSLRANARRDGFEECPDFEAFLEHSSRLCRHLSKQCRSSSLLRSHRVRLQEALQDAESTLNEDFLIDDDHLADKQAALTEALDRIEQAATPAVFDAASRNRLKAAREATSQLSQRTEPLAARLDGRILRHIDKKTLLLSVATTIVRHHPDRQAAEALIREVVAPYTMNR